MNEYLEIQKEQELIERAERETFRELNGFSESEDELIIWNHGVKNAINKSDEKMKCPICDTEIIKYSSVSVEYVEQKAMCRDEHHIYSYQYEEGNLIEQIGGVLFHNLNADSEEDRNLYELVIKHNREGYQKKVRA